MTSRSLPVLVLLAIVTVAAGQKERVPAPKKPKPVVPETEVLVQPVDTIAPDSIQPTDVRVERRSPGKAVLLSALLPGGGQVYTRNYWKAALIAPAELALGVLSVREYVVKEDARKEGSREAEYEIHRDRMAAYLWWTGAVVVFSMADAYVSAQMFGFNEQMEFSLGDRQPRLGFVLSPTRVGLAWRM